MARTVRNLIPEVRTKPDQTRRSNQGQARPHAHSQGALAPRQPVAHTQHLPELAPTGENNSTHLWVLPPWTPAVFPAPSWWAARWRRGAGVSDSSGPPNLVFPHPCNCRIVPINYGYPVDCACAQGGLGALGRRPIRPTWAVNRQPRHAGD